MISLKETVKGAEIKKAVCPHCKKTIHSVGFTTGSKCQGLTVVCKFCKRVYELHVD